MKDLEHKSFDIEIKNINEQGKFTAYASTFGNIDKVKDKVVKGAFTKTLENRNLKDIFMFWQHKSDVIIGEWISMVEDDKGLLVEGQLFIDDIQQAKEAFFLMKRGLIGKLSIGYSIIKKSFESGVRLLEEVGLAEISPVTWPANEEADIIGVKSMNINEYETIRDFEEGLRDSGFSKKEALEYISGVKELLRDSGEHKEEQKPDEVIKPCSEKEWGEIVLTLKSNIKNLKGTNNE